MLVIEGGWVRGLWAFYRLRVGVGVVFSRWGQISRFSRNLMILKLLLFDAFEVLNKWISFLDFLSALNIMPPCSSNYSFLIRSSIYLLLFTVSLDAFANSTSRYSKPSPSTYLVNFQEHSHPQSHSIPIPLFLPHLPALSSHHPHLHMHSPYYTNKLFL